MKYNMLAGDFWLEEFVSWALLATWLFSSFCQSRSDYFTILSDIPDNILQAVQKTFHNLLLLLSVYDTVSRLNAIVCIIDKLAQGESEGGINSLNS